MKTPLQFLMFVALLAAAPLHAQRDSGQILSSFHALFGDPKMVPHEGKVDRIERLPDGKSIVHFRAQKLDADRDYKPSGPMKNFSRRWPHAERPVPFVAGQNVGLRIDPAGKPVQVSATVAMRMVRFRADGEVELALHPSDDPKTLLLVHPQRVGAFSSQDELEMIWDLQFGLVVTVTAAGPGEIEQEALARRKAGIPFSNVPGESLTPGRNGWRAPKAGDLDRLPDKQFTTAAG